MSEETMENQMEEIEKSIADIEDGSIVKGKVISVNDNEAILDIKYSSEAILSKKDLSYEDVSPKEILSEGDEIEVYVVKTETEDGNVIVSKLRADKVVGKKELEEALESGEVVNVKVFKEVKGGVLADYKSVKLFIPASLLSVNYIEDLGQFVNKELDVKIVELDFSENRIIGSRKAVEEVELKAKKEEVLANLAKDDIVEGTVTKLTNFGAFVDLGGIDGLIHISQMSWDRIDHPKEVLSEGQKVKVEVLKVDKEEERISLKLDTYTDNPWNDVDKYHKPGDVTEGVVKRIADFGAFIELESGIEGLVHISQVADHHVENINDELEVGETVQVKILDINKDRERIGLSMKDVINVAQQQEADEDDVTLGDVFGDKLKDLF